MCVVGRLAEPRRPRHVPATLGVIQRKREMRRLLVESCLLIAGRKRCWGRGNVDGVNGSRRLTVDVVCVGSMGRGVWRLDAVF